MKQFLVYLISACLLSACYQPISDTDEKNGNKKKAGMTCELQVSVFGNIDTELYPTYLLLFDEDGKCIKEQTLTQLQPKALFTVNYGQYRVAALSGTAYYTFPTTKKPESKLIYNEALLPQQPLLMGQALVNISSPTAFANLQMNHQTAEVTVNISDLSTKTQKVSFALDAPYHSISLQNNLEDPKTLIIPCKQNGHNWSGGPYYLLPTQGSHVTASLEVLQGDTTLFYGYNLPFALQANYHYQINLSVEDGLQMNGETIKPYLTTASCKSDSIVLQRLPEVPSFWDDHLLVHIAKESASQGELWLLSYNEWEEVPSYYNEDFPDAAQAIADSYEEGGKNNGSISFWSIPSRDDANTLKMLYSAQNVSLLNDLLATTDLPFLCLTDESGDNVRYLCNEGQNTFTLASSSSSISKAGSKATYHLRLIKKIHYRVK